ncbi:hypothetical protein PHJA_002305200 [Phtheirospermum japonicum]|uniref:Uncharacterized protein n=1 Tax=Phtheirospermum japonicum TaxID=374723 RepID=A0A830CTT9_9LAMI|nr:hypothetical protein PHJA_002305200 [Phtheirospermum japonicum]
MARTTGVSNPIRSPIFRLSVSVSAQESAFSVGVLSDLYAFHLSTENSLCPYRTPIQSLLLLREKKFTTRGPSTSMRHCYLYFDALVVTFKTFEIEHLGFNLKEKNVALSSDVNSVMMMKIFI